MTVNTKEDKVEKSLIQEKVDTNASQQNDDATLKQNVEAVPVQQQAEESKEDPNWRAFREARKKDRIEKEAAERKAMEKEQEVAALKAAMEAAFAKGNNQQQQQYNQNEYQTQEETEENRVKRLVQEEISRREARGEQERIEREKREYPDRLMQSYPDFNATISSENLDYLDYHYPEVARPLKRQSDGFDKWSDIYLAIKKFVPNATTAKKEIARAEANFNKPRSMSSTGLTQTGEPQGSARLTEERKAANWARMQKDRKSIG